MTSTLSSEIYWLTLTTIMTPLIILPYAYVRIAKISFLVALKSPLPGDDPFDLPWAHRAYRAHMNAIENLAIFAPLTLAITVTGLGNEVTALASATYFWARLVHAPAYILKLPYVRTFAWMVGLGACFVLAYELLA